MKQSLRRELQNLFPIWLGFALLPLPALLLWRDSDGISLALFLFSIGCASLVAFVFRHDVGALVFDNAELTRNWRERMTGATIALIANVMVFSLFCTTLIDEPDFVAVFLACLIPIPALCVVPFFMLTVRQPLGAVVFTLATVFGMKLLGCIVVVLVYGWHADRHVPPYTDMPWTQPNLLVWLFWINTGVLSLSLYRLGLKKFYNRNEDGIVLKTA